MTLMKTTSALIAAMALLAAALPAGAAPKTPVPAPAAVPAPDTLCLAVYLAMAASDDQTTKSGGLLGSVYYAGRLEGRNPNVDPIDLVIALLKTPGAEAMVTGAADRCGKELQAMGQRWVTRGAEMQAATGGGGQ